MSGRLVISRHKSWHVWNQDNVENVLRDERLNKEAEEQKTEEFLQKEQEFTLNTLRSEAFGYIESAESKEIDSEKIDREKFRNEEYETERKGKKKIEDRKSGIAPWGLSDFHVKPWYLESVPPVSQSKARNSEDPMASFMKFQDQIRTSQSIPSLNNPSQYSQQQLDSNPTSSSTSNQFSSSGSDSEEQKHKRHKKEKKNSDKKKKERKKEKSKKSKRSTNEKESKEKSLHTLESSSSIPSIVSAPHSPVYIASDSKFPLLHFDSMSPNPPSVIVPKKSELYQSLKKKRLEREEKERRKAKHLLFST